MHRAVLLATLIALGSTTSQSALSSPRPMKDLTVPGGRLPAGCALSSADSRARGGWAGLGIPTNPWTGKDRRIIASIRARMDGPALVPDGPPLSARELSRYYMEHASGVEEGYAAVYLQAEPGKDLIVVYGLRFPSTEAAGDRPITMRTPDTPRATRVAIGQVVAVVHGDGGPCHQAVAAYLGSLAK